MIDLLKAVFPFSFQEKQDIAALVINILIQLAAGAVVALLIGVFSGVSAFGTVVSVLFGFSELYVAGGVVLSALDYMKILK